MFCGGEEGFLGVPVVTMFFVEVGAGEFGFEAGDFGLGGEDVGFDGFELALFFPFEFTAFWRNGGSGNGRFKFTFKCRFKGRPRFALPHFQIVVVVAGAVADFAFALEGEDAGADAV